MTPLLFALVSLAGGIGAALRFVVDGFVSAAAKRFPLGTMVVNVSGSFTLGLVSGLVVVGVVSPEWHAVVGSGLLGGYTTFSTASLETIRLLQHRRRGPAVVNALGTLVLTSVAAAIGLALPFL